MRNAITFVASVMALTLLFCVEKPEPKFAHSADVLCAELEDVEPLQNAIFSVHLLMQRSDYDNALKVADELLASLNEEKEVEGARELRALIFLLQGIVKGTKNDG